MGKKNTKNIIKLYHRHSLDLPNYNIYITNNSYDNYDHFKQESYKQDNYKISLSFFFFCLFYIMSTIVSKIQIRHYIDIRPSILTYLL